MSLFNISQDTASSSPPSYVRNTCGIKRVGLLALRLGTYIFVHVVVAD